MTNRIVNFKDYKFPNLSNSRGLEVGLRCKLIATNSPQLKTGQFV